MSENQNRKRYNRYLDRDNPTDIPLRTRSRYSEIITNEVETHFYLYNFFFFNFELFFRKCSKFASIL